MVEILKFFTGYSVVIYIILFIGFLYGFRTLYRANLEKKASLFGLERETTNRQISQGATILILVALLTGAEIALTVFMSPNLPASSKISTPTNNPLVSPTITLPAEFLGTIGLLTPAATQTSQTSGCIPGQIMITSPRAGEVVKAQVVIMGTADIPNFGFYKYEFAYLGSENWSTIQANRDVKRDAELGRWDTSEVTPGDYILRLVVLDNQGNSLPACQVPLRVAAP